MQLVMAKVYAYPQMHMKVAFQGWPAVQLYSSIMWSPASGSRQLHAAQRGSSCLRQIHKRRACGTSEVAWYACPLTSSFAEHRPGGMAMRPSSSVHQWTIHCCCHFHELGAEITTDDRVMCFSSCQQHNLGALGGHWQVTSGRVIQ